MDQREFHQRREQAIWQTKVAGYAAFASATLAVVMFVSIGISTGDWVEVLPFLFSAALTFGFGAGVYFGRSQIAAGALAILAIASLVWRVVQTGQFGGVLVVGLLIYFYVRGFLGALDLEELEKLKSSGSSEPAI